MELTQQMKDLLKMKANDLLVPGCTIVSRQMHGTRWVDATEDWRMYAPRDVLDKARPFDPGYCLIALSVMQAQGDGIIDARIREDAAFVYLNNGIGIRFRLMTEERRLIKTFDASKARVELNGLWVTLTAMTPKYRLGARAGSKSGTNVRTGKARNAISGPRRSINWDTLGARETVAAT